MAIDPQTSKAFRRIQETPTENVIWLGNLFYSILREASAAWLGVAEGLHREGNIRIDTISPSGW